jgi:hypothetical protein
MYSINPGLAGPLVNDRVAELRRSAAGRAARGAPRSGSLRRKAGWALVSLGLRLVLPRRSVLRGRSLFVRRSSLRPAR